MTLLEADRLFISPSRLDAVKSLLMSKRESRLAFTGLTGSAPAMLFAALAVDTAQLPILLIVADDMEQAGYIYNDIRNIAGEQAVAIFPSGYKRSIRFGQADPPSRILRADTLERVLASSAIAHPKAKTASGLRCIVSYPEALAEQVADRKDVSESTIALHVGMKVDMSDVVKRLIDLGFNSVEYVYEPGQFARRGSILDVYSFSGELPYRLDFFDDEIDSIRIFNVETQLSENQVDSVSVLPASSGETARGVSLLEFIGDNLIVAARDFNFITSRINDIAAEQFSESALIADEGDPDALKKVVDPAVFASQLSDARQLSIAPTSSSSTPDSATIRFNTSLQALYHKNFSIIAESFSNFLSEGYRILLLSDSSYQADRLKSIFADRGDKISFSPVSATLHEGFIDHDAKVCFFTDHQIFDRFHKYSLRSDKARAGKLALSIKELNQIEIDDYIVHIDHGIGRFGGLVKTDINGRPQEMIKVFFQDNALVLVSIHALHKLSKYRAKDGIPPKISKLGGGAWQRMKDRTKAKMKDMARELISLYAKRRTLKGHAFAPDSYLQHELEASFIYEDTPDQLRATQAVKNDMELPKPMDRLVCGDVGFGKTEIAVRAAFKAAADSKQVAVLVPTTVLALQHYNTFSSRLKDLPVRVEFISRAKKPKELKQILTDLEAGKIDIIIGTHKLIGKSVKFKDLGLLIIDEEQKFGVAVKEKLKQLKANIDTLTMSATPIPRTLQFSLMGARDLSSLNTPPANRQPINTAVSSFDEDVIREAIEFELSRNGQVFFVSNRIENLNELEVKLRRLVPGIRIVVAHGQMPPEKLEQAIVDFTNHDYDVLLSTTIVENGIDMPNVNTIIVNNADRFGLSELHQLRGRVGRSNRKAFCYLLVTPGKPLTPVARRRLQAIENFSDLGSGIHIAMQDLDIRGAGNLLGSEQSGFIADLGYEAYQQILKEAVTELKTEEFGDTFTDISDGREEEFVNDVSIESDLELRLPPHYVPQESERISLYRSLDAMERPEQVDEFRNNLIDRFGPIPQVSEELIKVVPLRIAAKRLGIERIVLKNNLMRLYFVNDDNKAYYQSPAFGRILNFMQSNPKRATLKDIPSKTQGASPTHAMIVSEVPSVSEALSILTQIQTLTPL